MLRNKSVILSFCFIICLGLSWSQTYTVSGKVLDFKTENPIGNVNIYIENSEIGIKTDKEGFFTLYLNNQLGYHIDLNIEMIGYQKEIIHIDLLKSRINLDEIYLKNK